MARLLVLVGLTGVGKASLVAEMRARLPALLPLLERRALTDRVIIPEILRDEGRPLAKVSDRLERFRLNARYRAKHPGGAAFALVQELERLSDGRLQDKRLQDKQPRDDRLYLFDNLRGVDEVRFAAEQLPGARFAVLDAPDTLRVLRMLGRRDPFDQLAGQDGLESGSLRSRALLEALERIPEVDAVLGRAALEAFSALPARDPGVTAGEVVSAVRVIVEESRHYNNAAVLAWLKTRADQDRFLTLDSTSLRVDEAAERIVRWLGEETRP